VWTAIGLVIYVGYRRNHAKPPRFVLRDAATPAE
jgi:hypothetical protein